MQSSNPRDYERVETALNYVAENFRQQPTLGEIASVVNLSEHHFQRMFQRWAGVSPKQFLQYLTVKHAGECLKSGMSAFETSYEVGLNAPARLGELFIRLEAMSPGEFKKGGSGLNIEYGYHNTSFGECLIGITVRGVCGLWFIDSSGDPNSAPEVFVNRFPQADFHYAPDKTASVVAQIFESTKPATLSLLVAGTAFQLKVWEALLQIPAGGLVSYQHIARAIDNPAAVRAVGTAVGQNPLALLIPCHRVIRGDGQPGGYRWGLGRKLALQGWEASAASVDHQ